METVIVHEAHEAAADAGHQVRRRIASHASDSVTDDATAGATEVTPLLLAPFPPFAGAGAPSSNTGPHDGSSDLNIDGDLITTIRNVALRLNALFSVVLLVSIVLLCLGTVPSVAHEHATLFFFLNLLSILVFTIEFAIDIIIYPHSNIHMILNPIFIIDFLAIFPFYLEIVVSILSGSSIIEGTTSVEGFAALRVLRLLRVFRLFKVFDKSSKLRLLGQALVQSTDGIMVLVLVAPLLVCFFGTLSFYAEQTDEVFRDGVWYYTNGDKSQFQSIPDCFWLTIVTLTTVGYGDVTPRTTAGRIVSALASLTALVFLAFPLTVITSQYSSVLEEEKDKLKEDEKQKEQEDERRATLASLNHSGHYIVDHGKGYGASPALSSSNSALSHKTLPVASVLEMSRHDEVVHLRIAINGEEGMRRVMQALADMTSSTPHHWHPVPHA